MSRLIWIVAGAAFLVWSGFAWLSHGVVEWIAAFASNHADRLTLGPDFAGLLAWSAELVAAAGGVAIFLIWLIGCAAIAVLAFLSSQLLARRVPRPQLPGYQLPPSRR